jgi:tetratricopeptide (TPR) repeat protein
MPNSSRIPHLQAELWVGLVAFCVRLYSLTHFSESMHFLPDQGDMKFYNDWALRILGGQWTDGHAFYGLPGYAFFVAAVYFVTGFNPFAVAFLQAISEAVVSVLIFKIAEIAFADEKNAGSSAPTAVGLMAALGWIFFQPAQTFSVVLMPTTWLVLAFWGTIYVLLKTRRSSIWQPWLLLGLLFGLVSMMIATILFLIPLALAAIILTLDRDRPTAQRLPRIAAAAGVLILSVFAGAAPCWLHNRFVAHEPVMLSAHSGVNFYIGNNPAANGYPKIPRGLRASQAGMLKDSITMAEAAAGRPLSRVEVSRFWSAKASDYIRAHPGEWLRLLGVKFRNFWNAFQYDDLSLISLFREEGVVTPGLRFGWVAALALPGIALAFWRHPRARWVVAAVLLHMAALMPVFVTERYRLAAAPGLLLLAAAGVHALWKWLVAARWKPALGFMAGAAASAAFVAWPQADPALWSLDFYNTGVKASRAGDLARAQRCLELAYAYVPDNSEINFALGNLWLEKKDVTRAKQFYKAAIEINPGHASAYSNLGVIALDEKRPEIAERFFVRSIAQEPDDAKTFYLLARARLEQGNTAGARESVEKAIAMEPNRREFLALRDAIAARESM